MSFSTALLLLAIAHAVVGLVAARGSKSLGGATIRALAGSAASTMVVTLAWRSGVNWFDTFALAHVVYLAIAATVPAMAVGALIARQREFAPYLSSRIAGAFLAAAMLPAAVGLYGTHVEPSRLEVDHHAVRLPGANNAAEPAIRIAVMADVQTARIRGHELDALAEVAAAEPDVLLIAGDLWAQGVTRNEWQGFRSYIASMVDAATTVIFVEGDSDNVERLAGLAKNTGAHVLADDVIDIDVRGQTVRVAGLTLRVGPANGRQRAAIEQLSSASPDTITVLLSHRPDAVYDLLEPIDLVVAGHTHGGQVALPIIGPLLTLSAVPRSVAAGGLHTIDGQAIYVSTGVGMERGHAPQVRIGARPSVGVLDLFAAAPS